VCAVTTAASRSAGAHPGGSAREAYIEALAKTGVGMVCILDREGRIVGFDEGCERSTGFSADEVIGRDARDVVIPPEEAEDFGHFLDAVWETGDPSPQVGHWLTRDGDRRLISWSNRPIVDDQGEVTQLFTVGIDLTERERANAELRAVYEELAQRLYELEQLAAEQSGLRRVALLVAGEASPEAVFDAVAAEVAQILGAETAAIARFDDSATATFVGRWNAGPDDAYPPDLRLDLRVDSAVARVAQTGESVWIGRYDDVHGEVSERMRSHGYRCAAAAPVTVAGRLWGAIVVAATDLHALPEGATERRLLAFSQIVALGLANADAREQLLASRKRLVQVADDERRRLERDLHDGAQQRLVTVAQRLYLAQRFLNEDTAATAEQLDICVAEVRDAIDDLRRLATGLHPPILTEAGLRPALSALVRRSPLPVSLGSFPEQRFSAEIETATYYLVSEALTNTAKHAGATTAKVDVQAHDGRLVIEVADDGTGGADPAKGSGLRGLSDRVEAVGGSLAITSTTVGTTLRAEFPLGEDES
jgi:PAS domain S-box-containing protein